MEPHSQVNLRKPAGLEQFIHQLINYGDWELQFVGNSILKVHLAL